MKTILPILAIAVLICGCTGTMERKSYTQHLDYFRTKAEPLVRQSCTNDVPGLTQIIGIDIDDGSRDIQKWKADATVEYMDKSGSLEQKKLGYGFVDTGNDLNCFRKY